MSDPNALTDFQQGNLFFAARDYKKAIDCFLRHAQTNPQERAKAYAQVAKCFRHISPTMIMKPLILIILFLFTYVGVPQINQESNTPVQILFGKRTPGERRRGPLHSGVLNSKLLNELEVTYPEKAKEKNIEGRVEIQLLVNEDGDVIFANPLSGPEELWAESVKAAVGAIFRPTKLAGEPVKVAGRIILEFKNGQVVVPK